jgi:hypothetical protein
MALADVWGGVKDRTQVHRLQISETFVELQIAGHLLAQVFLPALAHLLQLADDRPPDITFHLWDGAETGIAPPPPPFTPAAYRRYGQRAVAYDGAFSLMHAPHAGLLYAYDQSSRQGYFWCRDAAQLSIYERAAPVQTLFHWALREYGWQVIHAAAVGTESGGVLLAGNTGAGKSTTALALLEQRNGHASPPALSQRRQVPGAPVAPARGLCPLQLGQIEGGHAGALPGFRSLIQGWDDAYKAGKSLAFLHPTYASRMIQRFPVAALITPRIAHLEQPCLTPAPGPDVFRVLGPSTVIWLPGAEADNYRFTANLVRTLPCYQLDLATEPTRNSAAMQDILEHLQ